MNIDHLPFFNYGSASPNTTKYNQYGLYNLIANRFILVHSNPAVLTSVGKLFSSRYALTLCRLDCAENFEDNLIDNLVCLNWTIHDATDSKFTGYSYFNEPPVEIKLLIPTTSDLDPDDLVVLDQPYLHFALMWVRLLQPETDGSLSFKGDIQNNLIELPFETEINQQRSNIRREVYEIIYKTFDFNDAKLKIENLKNKYDFAAIDICFDKL